MSMRKRKKIQTLLRALIPGRSSRVLPLFLLVLGCAGWVSAATVQSGLRFAAAGGRVVIAGIVTDPLGMPVPQLSVLVSASARPLQADPRLGLKTVNCSSWASQPRMGHSASLFRSSPGNRNMICVSSSKDASTMFASPGRSESTSPGESMPKNSSFTIINSRFTGPGQTSRKL